ncbi:phenylalanine--tRNA ligase subunit alpha [Candidatus Woesearchaeota archaeon]|nr:phenylalanine--tRNA ligase subunit alpha [Candidatus Woesearchaeota archaeon]
MEIQKIIDSLTEIERKVLNAVNKFNAFEEIQDSTKLSEVEVMRALQWLQNKKVIDLNENIKELVELDVNGKNYVKKGLPERIFLEAVKNKTLTLGEVKSKTGLDKNEINICIGTLRKKAAIDVKKDKELSFSINEQGKKLLAKESLEEQFLKKKFPLDLSLLKPEEKFAYEELKKRKNILKKTIKKLKYANLTSLGKKLLKQGIKTKNVIEKLSLKEIKSGKWKNKSFRRYDVSINVPRISGGKRHFTKQAVDYIKKIWIELGFKEMTGPLVQTSFWDLDALFVPQDHPARDVQDTFYIKDPAKGRIDNKQVLKRVKATHENGWTTGSLGWQCEWSTERAKENLLRTHNTVLSARTISELKKQDLPVKFFSVAKVFRNETLDWKHLFEFYQVEGIVVDPDVTFRNLLGYLTEFYKKMGYPKVRIKPGHFPYTEPSAEVSVFHPVRKEWVELGGSGVFRPEVVKPLLGIDIPVLAWGQGMGRIISEYWEINDIRELYKNDLKQLREMKIWLR